MKLQDFNAASDYYTEKASEIIRYLILAGIGIIWLFKYSEGEKQGIDRFLIWPLVLLCLAYSAINQSNSSLSAYKPI